MNSDLGYSTLSIPVGMAVALSAMLPHRRDAKTRLSQAPAYT
jgi:hypothetical protein